MPLLQDKHGQTRLNNPSSTGAKQDLVGSTDLPCWNSAHVYVGWAALSFDPAGRTVTRSHCASHVVSLVLEAAQPLRAARAGALSAPCLCLSTVAE